MLIASAGWIARRNRTLLARLFRPGLYLTGLFVILFMAVQAVLAISSLYYLEATLIGRFHVGLLIAIAAGAVLGIGGVAKAVFSLVHEAELSAIGVRLSKDSIPRLWAFVRRVADSVGTAPPENIVLGLEPNFFVTYAKVRTPTAALSGRTLFMSLPLMRILAEKEIAAILGHELGHYRGADTDYSLRFYPIYRGTSNALHALNATGGAALAQLPAVATLSYFLDAFAEAEKGISRERELVADSVGAEVGGPEAMATALVKVHAYDGCWPFLLSRMVEGLAHGKVLANACEGYSALIARTNDQDDVFAQLGNHRTSHPTDSHPPLSLRLERCGYTVEGLARSVRLAHPQGVIDGLEVPSEWEREATKTQYALIERFLESPNAVRNAAVCEWSDLESEQAIGSKKSASMPHVFSRGSTPQTPPSVQCWRCKQPLRTSGAKPGAHVKCQSCGTKQALPL